MVVGQLALMVNRMASSRAGSLPQILTSAARTFCACHGSNVGAELAREGDVSGDINVECAAVFASNLCSYRYLRWA
jgi:hypothetical protein